MEGVATVEMAVTEEMVLALVLQQVVEAVTQVMVEMGREHQMGVLVEMAATGEEE